MEDPVLIVGAGPTGLLLAIQLLRHNISVRIIDKKKSIATVSRAVVLHARSLEILSQMGCLESFLEKGNRINAIRMHFSKTREATLQYRFARSPINFALTLPQSQTEILLEKRLNDLGGKVERSLELKDIFQNEEKVTAVLEREDGRQETLFTRYAVGCDGAKSVVRKKLGFTFLGGEYQHAWILLDCKMEGFGQEDELHIFATKNANFAVAPLGNKNFRISSSRRAFGIDPDSEPTLEEFQNLVNDSFAKSAKLSDPKWITKFHLHHRMVDRYFNKRIFLAGDAAHIHSPVGAQGMNTGMQDAFNLGWKLAFEIKEGKKTPILASYHPERSKVAETVVQSTHQMAKWMSWRNPFFIACRNIVLQTLFSMPTFQKKFINNMAGINICYEKSDLIYENWEGRASKKILKLGQRASNLNLQNSHTKELLSLYELLSGTKHHLFLIIKEAERSELLSLYESLKDAANESLKVACILSSDCKKIQLSGEEHWIADEKDLKIYGTKTSCLYLIRPDGHICYRNHPASLEQFYGYLNRL